MDHSILTAISLELFGLCYSAVQLQFKSKNWKKAPIENCLLSLASKSAYIFLIGIWSNQYSNKCFP